MTIFFTEDHEYIIVDGEVGTVGISTYAQGQLGDVVYVELPAVGASFSKGDDAAVVESVKAASDIYAPASGEVTEVNTALEEVPQMVNEAAETNGWFFKMKLSDLGELKGLMSADAYKAYCEGL